jgi:hypothetical protein
MSGIDRGHATVQGPARPARAVNALMHQPQTPARTAPVNQKESTTMTNPAEPKMQNEPGDPPRHSYDPTVIDRRPDAGPVYINDYTTAIGTEHNDGGFPGRYLPAGLYAEHTGRVDIARAPFDEVGPKANPGGTGAQDAASAGYRL